MLQIGESAVEFIAESGPPARTHRAVAFCGDLYQRLRQRPWASREKLHSEDVHRIAHTYNRRRHQRALGKLPPVEFAFTPADDQTEAAA